MKHWSSNKRSVYIWVNKVGLHAQRERTHLNFQLVSLNVSVPAETSRWLSSLTLKIPAARRPIWKECIYWFFFFFYLYFLSEAPRLRLLKTKIERSEWCFTLFLSRGMDFYYIRPEEIQWNQFWTLRRVISCMGICVDNPEIKSRSPINVCVILLQCLRTKTFTLKKKKIDSYHHEKRNSMNFNS